MADEAHIAATADLFRSAATGTARWEDALNGFADATGSRTGQLIALGRDSLVPLNIMTRMPDESAVEFLEFGGGSPEVNSRVRVGGAAPEMKFLDQADFDVEEDRARSPEFGAWIDRYDIGYTCITTLVRRPDMLIGFAALRSTAEGEMRAEDKRAFMTLAGHARSAVNLAIAIEGEQARGIAGSFEHMAQATLIFDGAAKLLTMSPSAERIMADGKLGRLASGEFRAHLPSERDRFDNRLRQAILARVDPAVPPPLPTGLTGADDHRIVAEFVPLPTETGFKFTAAVMVILRSLRRAIAPRAARVARELFGLTDTEEMIASYMLCGKAPQDISRKTGRTVGTVRNHVHRILSKSHCTSQVEFLALVARFE